MMELFHTLIGYIRNPGELIAMGGFWGLVLIIFLETGALVFFLPGDSLLVVAGLYAAKGDLSIGMLQLLALPAILGDATSYVIGKQMGQLLFTKAESRFFKPQYLLKARDFYEKHGGKAIIIARFMPIVRTFVPVVAGAAKMTYGKFASFNVIGGIAWVTSMTLIGYLLGNVVPNIDKHIEKVIVVVVFISIAPGLWEWWKAKRVSGAAQG